MSRNRPRGPRTHDHAIVRLADSIDRLATALAERHEPRAVVALPTPELVPARLITVEHFGSWVEIPGRPVTSAERNDPSILSQGGMLVGVRLGTVGRGAQVPERVLVVSQGGENRGVSVRVDAPVRVFPRGVR